MLAVRATTGDDANRFDVALSSSPTANNPVSSAKLWTYGVSFELVTDEGQSAEARFFVPQRAQAVSVTTADASRARVRAETPRRSDLVIAALADGALGTTRLTVEGDDERDADWAVAMVWLGAG